jgi:hypothetical protein
LRVTRASPSLRVTRAGLKKDMAAAASPRPATHDKDFELGEKGTANYLSCHRGAIPKEKLQEMNEQVCASLLWGDRLITCLPFLNSAGTRACCVLLAFLTRIFTPLSTRAVRIA